MNYHLGGDACKNSEWSFHQRRRKTSGKQRPTLLWWLPIVNQKRVCNEITFQSLFLCLSLILMFEFQGGKNPAAYFHFATAPYKSNRIYYSFAKERLLLAVIAISVSLSKMWMR
jgi:hypothetical protein